MRPVFFRNDPKRDSFFVLPLVFTTRVFLSVVADRLRSDNLGIGFSVGSGFKRGSGFNPGNAGIAVSGFAAGVAGLSKRTKFSGFAFRALSEVEAATDTTGDGSAVSNPAFGISIVLFAV
jgi:hypothetical protein